MPRRIDGSAITTVIYKTKCYGCGMPLLEPDEYHPDLACQIFKRTQDSEKVWRSLDLGRNDDD